MGTELFDAALGRDLEEGDDARENALGPARGEEDVFAVGGPADHGVVGAVEGELFRLATGGGDDENVVIAVAAGGEGDPVAIRREAWIDVARLVVGEAGDAAAVLVGDPEVAEVAEGDLAFGIGRVAEEFHLRL